MSKVRFILMLLVLATLVFATGCQTPSGSREFIPGKGWVPVE